LLPRSQSRLFWSRSSASHTVRSDLGLQTYGGTRESQSSRHGRLRPRVSMASGAAGRALYSRTEARAPASPRAIPSPRNGYLTPARSLQMTLFHVCRRLPTAFGVCITHRGDEFRRPLPSRYGANRLRLSRWLDVFTERRLREWRRHARRLRRDEDASAAPRCTAASRNAAAAVTASRDWAAWRLEILTPVGRGHTIVCLRVDETLAFWAPSRMIGRAASLA
jgi:hypothetical protein